MHKQILALALPSIISNISVPLASSVDTMLMGHLSTLHLASLGSVGMIFIFLYGSLNFLRMGTTGLTAQAYGAKQSDTIQYTLYRALGIALVLGLLIILLQYPILRLSFWLMNINAHYESYANTYFMIRIYAAPATLMLYTLIGWFFGMQNARYPLYITLVMNSVNILLSILLVNQWGFGIEGVAYGTLIAEYVGLLFGLLLLLNYKGNFKYFSLQHTLQKEKLLHFFSVNRILFVRTLTLTFSFAFFYAQAAKEGEETLAIMVLLLQFIIWFAFSLDGFANAAESLVGKFYGAKAWTDFYKVIRLIFYWSLGFTLLYMLTYALFTKTILQLYTNQTLLIETTMSLLPYLIAMPLLSFGAYIWDGIFVGMTATKAMRNSVMIGAIIYITLFYLTKSIDFTYALWLSFLSFFLVRGVVQTLLFIRRGKVLQ